MDKSEITPSGPWSAVILAFILAGLWLTSLHGFLLFHSLAEGFSIACALGIFMVAWHSRRFLDNNYLAFVGVAYLFVATLDMVHTLAYKGLGVFPEYGADLATCLWIAARYLQAFSLLAAPFFFGRRLRYNLVFAVLTVVTAALLAAAFSGRFPVCFDETSGLTPFKKASEYAIILVLAASAALLWPRREFDRGVRRLIVGSIVLTAASEFFFTQYANVYGQSNLAGHLLKIAAFYLMYKAIIETGLAKPYDLLFRNLKRSEEELREDNEKLLALQRQLEEKNEELSRLNELKNHFLGMAAHDLRSPLTVIDWYSDYLLENASPTLGDRQKTFLCRIKESCEFMLGLVDNLLDISQIESGKLVLECRPADLISLVERNVELNRVLAGVKDIRIDFEPCRLAAPLSLDTARVEQALNNLISNAVKFSHSGTAVKVKVSCRDGFAEVSVRDQGQGIPAAEIDKLFHPFQKTSVKSTAGEKSTGLGLAIVRKIVEAHGGKIIVESEVGKGSDFHLLFPLRAGGSAPGESAGA